MVKIKRVGMVASGVVLCLLFGSPSFAPTFNIEHIDLYPSFRVDSISGTAWNGGLWSSDPLTRLGPSPGTGDPVSWQTAYVHYTIFDPRTGLLLLFGTGLGGLVGYRRVRRMQ